MLEATHTQTAAAPPKSKLKAPAKPAAQPKAKLPRKTLLIAWVVAAAAFGPMLDTTMVNIAVNDLATSFNTTLGIVQWVVTGYVLAQAVAVPFSGWLSDHIDMRRLFIIAELLVLAASLAAGFAVSIAMLIACCLVQGFAAGLITPLTTTALVRAAGKQSLGSLIAIVGTPMILGPILGPVLGGLLCALGSWRLIFFVNIVFVAAALVLLWRALPQLPPPSSALKGGLDWGGITLVGLGSIGIIYGMAQLDKVGAGGAVWQLLVPVGLGVVLIAAYVLYAHRRSTGAPVLPLALFHSRKFCGASVGLFLAGLATNGPMLLLPLLFQNVYGLSVIWAALALAPQGVAMLITRPLIGKLTDRLGARKVATVCLVLSAVATLPFVWFNAGTPLWLVLVVLFVRGLGIGGITLPLMSDSYTDLGPELTAQASVGGRIIQTLGASFGTAVLSGVLVATGGAAAGFNVAFAVALVATLAIIVPAHWLTSKQ
jgi:EmrB/QacA subfamily drug resistance transporter